MAPKSRKPQPVRRGQSQVQRVVNPLVVAGTAPASPFVMSNTPFFDRCETEILSLHQGGRMGLIDLFNWSVSNTWLRTLKFITYLRPAHVEGTPTVGYLADPCTEPNGYEFGSVSLTMDDFGRYGRKGPVRDIWKPEKFCETDPVYRLDGTPVTSEREWDMQMAMTALKDDLFRDIIVGNASTPGQFDGLLQWINTGYESPMLDSMVFDWAGNDVDGNGGGPITLNGVPLTSTFDLVDLLLSIYRRYKQRIGWSPQLSTQTRSMGDFVLVMPSFLINCLLNKYTCWSVCEGRQYNEANIQTFEARRFRDTLMGGLYGYGQITLDGDVIPIYVHDWETIHGVRRGDIFFMTMSVGNVRIWEGEHLSATAAAATVREEGHTNYFATDGGRVIASTYIDNLCKYLKLWMRPRLWCRAPYLQARIMNVECGDVLDPLSPDPLATSWYPVLSFGGEAATVA